MKKFTKTCAIFLTGLMALSAFSCKGGTDATEPETPEIPETPAKEGFSKETVTVEDDGTKIVFEKWKIPTGITLTSAKLTEVCDEDLAEDIAVGTDYHEVIGGGFTTYSEVHDFIFDMLKEELAEDIWEAENPESEDGPSEEEINAIKATLTSENINTYIREYEDMPENMSYQFYLSMMGGFYIEGNYLYLTTSATYTGSDGETEDITMYKFALTFSDGTVINFIMGGM